MKNSQITHWCHEIIKSQAPRGGFYIDATMGKGNDTAFFCELAGEDGAVLAFDVQIKAIEATAALLIEKGLVDRATLIMDGHEKMKESLRHIADTNRVNALAKHFLLHSAPFFLYVSSTS